LKKGREKRKTKGKRTKNANSAPEMKRIEKAATNG